MRGLCRLLFSLLICPRVSTPFYSYFFSHFKEVTRNKSDAPSERQRIEKFESEKEDDERRKREDEHKECVSVSEYVVKKRDRSSWQLWEKERKRDTDHINCLYSSSSWSDVSALLYVESGRKRRKKRNWKAFFFYRVQKRRRKNSNTREGDPRIYESSCSSLFSFFGFRSASLSIISLSSSFLSLSLWDSSHPLLIFGVFLPKLVQVLILCSYTSHHTCNIQYDDDDGNSDGGKGGREWETVKSRWKNKLSSGLLFASSLVKKEKMCSVCVGYDEWMNSFRSKPSFHSFASLSFSLASTTIITYRWNSCSPAYATSQLTEALNSRRPPSSDVY